MAFHQALRRYTTSSAAPSCVKLLPEVAEALSSGRPVVALESTIVAHGMPYPQNLELAKDVSQILRNKGVIPATIAIKNGVFRVGLHPDELEDLAQAGEEGRAMKCSTRDLPLVASKHRRIMSSSEENVQWGATTVAATMRLAHAAGIKTFVTGGTGGVHRGGELSLDISTDLIELSRTPVVVVSAGVKSILDVKRTLEMLETLAVPVGTWKSDEFPAFFSPISGVKSPTKFDNAMDVASAFLTSSKELGMPCGMLVAVPNHDPAGQNVEIAIQEALQEAEASGIQGRDVTPFILRTVAEKTDGDSLRSNMSLVKRNAEVGADIANSIRDLSLGGSTRETVLSSRPKMSPPKSRVVCVGGAVIDTVASPENEIIGTSNPGKIHRSDGGVGRNVAEVLGRLGSTPLFYTAIGKADGGQGIVSRLEKECGVITTTKSVQVADGNTAQYLALLDKNSELVGGVADMEVLSKIPIPSVEELHGVDYLVLDANAPVDSVTTAAKNGVRAGSLVCFEPTSVPKAKLLSSSNEFMECLNYVFPNEDELFAMAKASDDGGVESEEGQDSSDEYKPVRDAALKMLSRMASDKAHIVVSLGSRGVLLASKADALSSPEFRHFPADVVSDIKSSNGAGDTLCGAFVHALLRGAGEEEAVQFGMNAALLSLDCAERAIS
eukprot:CAMPEP_0172313262 /NCGR_PEP_ID=MMETSP1058-20130122/19849_1 /TAXON_ID=83371 /ORGANISM="Detonula confervacea, Strain CCMP 353" /LENGTH=666 /DNA_ID=CAMNT_0013026885 /DNA_START=141 /DNA_END=2137 /DNA_ORIENTATION=+